MNRKIGSTGRVAKAYNDFSSWRGIIGQDVLWVITTVGFVGRNFGFGALTMGVLELTWPTGRLVVS